MVFVLISFALGSQHESSFQWNMGLRVQKAKLVEDFKPFLMLSGVLICFRVQKGQSSEGVNPFLTTNHLGNSRKCPENQTVGVNPFDIHVEYQKANKVWLLTVSEL